LVIILPRLAFSSPLSPACLQLITSIVSAQSLNRSSKDQVRQRHANCTAAAVGALAGLALVVKKSRGAAGGKHSDEVSLRAWSDEMVGL